MSIELIEDKLAHKSSGANRRKKYIDTFQPMPDTKILAERHSSVDKNMEAVL